MRHAPSLRMSLALLVLVALAGCATEVERIDASRPADLSGAWNDTDSRLVSEQMIRDLLSQPWLQEFNGRPGGRRPAVVVGEALNLSHEYINLNTFTLAVERALLNSGKVSLVAARSERRQIRDERRDQDINAREDTRKAMGGELGADFILTSTINGIVDPSGDRQVRFYQVNMTLISLADNHKAWIGQKDIRKLVTRSWLHF